MYVNFSFRDNREQRIKAPFFILLYFVIHHLAKLVHKNRNPENHALVSLCSNELKKNVGIKERPRKKQQAKHTNQSEIHRRTHEEINRNEMHSGAAMASATTVPSKRYPWIQFYLLAQNETKKKNKIIIFYYTLYIYSSVVVVFIFFFLSRCSVRWVFILILWRWSYLDCILRRKV